jgi:hypothetical protein
MAAGTQTVCYPPALRPTKRVANMIVLSNEEREKLRALVRSKRTSVRLAQRARIVLLTAV